MNDIFSKEFSKNIENMFDKMFEENEKSHDSNKIEEKMYLNGLLAEYFRRLGRTFEEYASVIPSTFDLLDVDTKIRILTECFDNECVIEKSKIYTSSLEGSFEPNYYQDPSKIK